MPGLNLQDHNASGSSTPSSSSSTLSPPHSPKVADAYKLTSKGVFLQPQIPASTIIEFIASRSASSSHVYIYDVAEHVGFGALTQVWADADSGSGKVSSVVRLQTRAGAGLSVVGRLSAGTSHDTRAVLTAYTTPSGLSAMAHALTYLPPATSASRLVVQVPTVTPVGETYTLSPTLAPLATALPLLPENIVIMFSATPQESVDLASLSYTLKDAHVIHFFDQYSSAREVGQPITAPKDVTGRVRVVDIFRSAGYEFFDFAGDRNAHTVLALLNGSLALATKAFVKRVPGLAVIIVRVLRPWDEEMFRSILPSTVRKVHVFDDVPNKATQGALHLHIFGSLIVQRTSPAVCPHRIVPSQTQGFLSQPASFYTYIQDLLPQEAAAPSIDSTKVKKLLFFGAPKSALSNTPTLVQNTFTSNEAITSRLLTDHDVFSRAGGISCDRILLSAQGAAAPSLPIPFALPIASGGPSEADFLAILDQKLLQTHDVLQTARAGSTVLVVTSWTSTELSANLPVDARDDVRQRSLRLCTIDSKAIATKLVGATGPTHDALQSLLVHLAFLRLYLGKMATEGLVHKIARGPFGDAVQGIELAKVNAQAWAGLMEVELSAEGGTTDAPPSSLKHFEVNAIAVEFDEGETIVNGARLVSWHDAAKHLLFPSVYAPPSIADPADEYSQDPALRPEVPERTFLVTTTVNRRLTPLEYDRNVFHLEFDTSGTGLKYAIGEALGVHGWNDEQDVLAFCAWYGVDPEGLITIPVPGGDGKMHMRTVLQALQQQVDLFGKPPKSFYADLAEYATNDVDKKALQFIGSGEGSSTYKKLSEKDTVTFADVLVRYPSARPGIEMLCEMVGDIKPRHYSIASAQSVVGDRVDLLVVTVDWVTPSGSPRYGQCTRYLAGLKLGQKVTVSIKPSVMKLPPDNLQPIILAGLGTGAAPFRAFLQHRAHLAAQNIPVGPTYYYFGSRHQASEYLYGEEIEAFIADGTITRAGLAFSRDGPKKVYIQHKMLEDAEQLAHMLRNEQGVFYLCGPTWPVPDVYKALVGALVKFNGMNAESAGEYLEGLKEEERYVLEVY